LDAWTGWPVERTLLALVAVLYAGIWVQVTLFHWAGAFAAKAMWAPVLETPVIVAGAVLGVAVRQDPWGWIALVFLALGALGGLYGTYRHLRGVRSQIGGFSFRNFVSGPPPLLPLAYSLVGVIGVIVLVWGGAGR
jgi:hypothetical protein